MWSSKQNVKKYSISMDGGQLVQTISNPSSSMKQKFVKQSKKKN